ncbi:MAG: indolepyruvate oxidoreductase subunit beta [Anaerolineales bacterium]|nr:indolepyruvate oxidoreductase subunit beta [Anaerolineales bacterium]
MNENINFLLAGVGGQGTILASDVLVNVGLAAGYQAKQAEVHGMSQRGGSVTSHVRWGKVVYSPIAAAGEVDVLLAFEKAEALRNIPQLRPGGLVVINIEAIKPLTVTSGGQPYPDDEHLKTTFAQATSHTVYVNGAAIATELGNSRVANVVLLGALAAQVDQSGMAGTGLTYDTWLEVIRGRVPQKYIELNQKAFQAGWEIVKK